LKFFGWRRIKQKTLQNNDDEKRFAFHLSHLHYDADYEVSDAEKAEFRGTGEFLVLCLRFTKYRYARALLLPDECTHFLLRIIYANCLNVPDWRRCKEPKMLSLGDGQG
jgi:hypothetical protein